MAAALAGARALAGTVVLGLGPWDYMPDGEALSAQCTLRVA